MDDFLIGDILKHYHGYYLVKALAPNGRPSTVISCNETGKITKGAVPITQESGFDVSWKLHFRDTKDLGKYYKVIRKIQQLDKRFEERKSRENLTMDKLQSIIERIQSGSY